MYATKKMRTTKKLFKKLEELLKSNFLWPRFLAFILIWIITTSFNGSGGLRYDAVLWSSSVILWYLLENERIKCTKCHKIIKTLENQVIYLKAMDKVFGR